MNLVNHENPVYLFLTTNITQQPEDDNKDQDRRDTATTKLPRSRAGEYSS
jgi:hypothetical protein